MNIDKFLPTVLMPISGIPGGSYAASLRIASPASRIIDAVPAAEMTAQINSMSLLVKAGVHQRILPELLLGPVPEGSSMRAKAAALLMLAHPSLIPAVGGSVSQENIRDIKTVGAAVRKPADSRRTLTQVAQIIADGPGGAASLDRRIGSVFDGGVVRSLSTPPAVRRVLFQFRSAVLDSAMRELAMNKANGQEHIATRQYAQRLLEQLWRQPTVEINSQIGLSPSSLSKMRGTRDWKRAAPWYLAAMRRWLDAAYGRVFEAVEPIEFVESVIRPHRIPLIQVVEVDGGREISMHLYHPYHPGGGAGDEKPWSIEEETAGALKAAAWGLVSVADESQGGEWYVGSVPLTGIRVIFHHELLATEYRVTPAEAMPGISQ